jgi:D-glycero-beta-D-manno-heptose 1-phosphate adenylyltransferase
MAAIRQESTQAKIITSPEDLARLLTIWKFQSKKIVFTNGCFDILHRGHVEYLSQASLLGDKLIIGMNTDSSVRILKGESRPVQDEYSRALILASLACVDLVVPFPEETPLQLIEQIRPDVLVKGGDYEITEIVGYELLKSYGGKVLTIDLTAGFSTTAILKKLGNPA